MSVKIEGTVNLGALLQQVGEKAVRGVFAQMKVEAQALAEKARENAPVDHGDLETAIKVRETGGGRNELGQFARKSVEVYVDGSLPAHDSDGRDRPGKTVGDYAYEMHEHLIPAGPLQLGPKSQQKDGGSGKVGGKYLERARDEIEQGIEGRLAGACQAAI
ncbi:HK97 gp10 family phage protein [Paraburkholderia sp.]|uniref:HK97 gp10 family phage protein n=1 Tax=Paraburkholderia sp. TaxID=1926495 RepID=UPI0039E5ABFC